MSIQEEYYAKKMNFVQLLISLLPFEDINDKLLEITEVKADLPSGYSLLLFPNGINEVVDFLEEYQDNNMFLQLTKLEQPIKIREKISLALKTRIKDISPLVSSKIATYFACPTNTLFGTKSAFRTCNIIWQYAGDKSLDFNYYTKRGLLLTVYLSAILYYIQDDSENYIETDKFIDESIDNIIKGFSYIKNFDISNIPIFRMFL